MPTPRQYERSPAALSECRAEVEERRKTIRWRGEERATKMGGEVSRARREGVRGSRVEYCAPYGQLERVVGRRERKRDESKFVLLLPLSPLVSSLATIQRNRPLSCAKLPLFCFKCESCHSTKRKGKKACKVLLDYLVDSATPFPLTSPIASLTPLFVVGIRFALLQTFSFLNALVTPFPFFTPSTKLLPQSL
jgi:hypothetical protein